MQREITLKKTNRVIEQLSEKSDSNSCSVHVRRDYLVKPFDKIYNICSQNYYKIRLML